MRTIATKICILIFDLHIRIFSKLDTYVDLGQNILNAAHRNNATVNFELKKVEKRIKGETRYLRSFLRSSGMKFTIPYSPT